MAISVALFGGTGVVGTEVLTQLDLDPNVTRIDFFSRRKPTVASSTKLVHHLSNLESAEEIATLLKGQPPNLALCCLGTTMAKAKSKDAFYRVDHDFVLHAARACRALGVQRFGVISSLGADAGARSFYLRVKGETERDLKALKFEKLVILRPSVLLGDRPDASGLLKFFTTLSTAASPLLGGPLTHYRPVHVTTVARCLINEALAPESGLSVVENERILSFSRKS